MAAQKGRAAPSPGAQRLLVLAHALEGWSKRKRVLVPLARSKFNIELSEVREVIPSASWQPRRHSMRDPRCPHPPQDASSKWRYALVQPSLSGAALAEVLRWAQGREVLSEAGLQESLAQGQLLDVAPFRMRPPAPAPAAGGLPPPSAGLAA